MDSCMTCKEKDNCIDYVHNGNAVGPTCWKPVESINACSTAIEKAGAYEKLGHEIGALVDEKNRQYGDSTNKTGEMLKIIYPNGVGPEQYHDMLLLVRIFDKVNRIANGNQGEENAWNDLVGYGLLGAKEE